MEPEESSELQTQINLFYEHKDLDAEEFSHRYDNIRLLMEYLLLVQLFYLLIVRVHPFITHEAAYNVKKYLDTYTSS